MNKNPMQPIFDFCAQRVSWLEGEIVFSRDGCPVAFINNTAVFAAQNGHYLGHLDKGVFRDRLGCIVAFSQETWCYTILTPPLDESEAPSIQSRLLPGLAHLSAAPLRLAKPLRSRSSLGWKQFMEGCKPQNPMKTRR